MPRRYKTGYKRRPRRPYRLRRKTRRTRRYKIPRALTHTYRFKRTTTLNDINSSNVGPVALTYIFTLSSVPGYTEFTALFDKFMITRVVVTFVPRDITAVTSPYHLYTPYFHTCIDHDDDTPVSSLAEIEQYQTYRKTPGTKPHRRILRPRVLSMTYKSAVTTAYSPSGPRWISTLDNTTPHYGLKVWIDQTASANAYFTWTPTIVFYLAFRDVL